MKQKKSNRGPDPAAKKAKQNHPTQLSTLLAANKFAPLTTPEVEKKEKMPPFYVREIDGNLKTDLDELIKRGLKASIKLCTDGYKIVVPSQQHYNAVEEYLHQKKAEYFSHDIPGKKPFKVVLRGLYEMEPEELKGHLTLLGLKVEAIHKIRRKQANVKFRDQLYLVHLVNGSTSLNDLKAIRAVTNVIVEWERYRPVHRDVTQCTKCFSFGHGARNCHMNPRCDKCGAKHDADECVTDVIVPKRCNCNGDHRSTDRNCPKRAEFVQMRRAAAAKRSPPAKKSQFTLNQENFPEFQPPAPRYKVPVLQPLPLDPKRPRNPQQLTLNSDIRVQNQPAGSSQGQTQPLGSQLPPGFRTFAQVTQDQPPAEAAEDLYTASELFGLFKGLMEKLESCKTKKEQHLALCEYTLHVLYGP